MATNQEGPMTPGTHADLVARLLERAARNRESGWNSDQNDADVMEAAASALAALPPPADPPHDCEAWRLEGLGCARCNKADPPALVALVREWQRKQRGCDIENTAAAYAELDIAEAELLAYPLPAAPPVTDTTSDAYERGKRDAVRALANATKKRLTDDSVAPLVAALTTADAPASAPRFAVGIDTQTGENRCVRIDGDAIGDESAWLIERDINSVLHYWTGRVIDGREIGAWSPNHLDARRFARREDAACMLTWHCGDVGRVAEHMWTPMRPPVTDTPQPGEVPPSSTWTDIGPQPKGWPDANNPVRWKPRPDCVIGVYCQRHGFIHGQEAEELRERLEELGNTAVNRVLDEVDARDSVAYLEATNEPTPPDAAPAAPPQEDQ